MGAPEFSYRPCVGVALFNSEGKVFIGRRSRDSGFDERRRLRLADATGWH